MPDTVKYLSEDNYAFMLILVERRADIMRRAKADKKALADAGASLQAKIQSERYFRAQLDNVNREIIVIPALKTA